MALSPFPLGVSSNGADGTADDKAYQRKVEIAKYLVCPDYLMREDGKLVYVGYKKLMRLYKVQPKHCCQVGKEYRHRAIGEHQMLLIPKWDGDYSKTPPCTLETDTTLEEELFKLCNVDFKE